MRCRHHIDWKTSREDFNVAPRCKLKIISYDKLWRQRLVWSRSMMDYGFHSRVLQAVLLHAEQRRNPVTTQQKACIDVVNVAIVFTFIWLAIPHFKTFVLPQPLGRACTLHVLLPGFRLRSTGDCRWGCVIQETVGGVALYRRLSVGLRYTGDCRWGCVPANHREKQ
jgi:hypothetical protein